MAKKILVPTHTHTHTHTHTKKHHLAVVFLKSLNDWYSKFNKQKCKRDNSKVWCNCCCPHIYKAFINLFFLVILWITNFKKILIICEWFIFNIVNLQYFEVSSHTYLGFFSYLSGRSEWKDKIIPPSNITFPSLDVCLQFTSFFYKCYSPLYHCRFEHKSKLETTIVLTLGDILS